MTLLVFHAYGVDALLNKAADGHGGDGHAAKLDWSEFVRTGPNTGLDISAALDAAECDEPGRSDRECGSGGGRRRWR